MPDKAPPKHRRLDSILNDVVAAYDRGINSASTPQDGVATPAAAAAASRAAAKRAPMSEGDAVAVSLRINDPAAIDAVVRFLEDNGGDPRNVGEDYIEAYVPVTLLVAASNRPGVFRIQAIIPPSPQRGPITSQGTEAHGASRWHAAGITRKGVKVGVIDSGFARVRELMGNELPARVMARCYRSMGRPTSNLSDCESDGDPHGTAVAEALLDVAPGVTLHIANPESPGDLASTVDWMAGQGVQVINFSASAPYDGPGDGTSPYMDSPLHAVDAAVGKGIVWVNAAGNEGLRVWFGAPNWGILDNHFFGHVYCHPLKAEEEIIWVQLRWEGRWGTNDQLADLDLYLRDSDGNVVDRSILSQDLTNWPTELLYFREASPGTDYCLSVVLDRRFPAQQPTWMQLVIHDGAEFEAPIRPWGSIGNPAESANPGLLAVGATSWRHPATIAEYSSRGPTPDGRIKPDIVGVDMAHSSSLRDEGNPTGEFMGTSQAAPHVAGLAALVRSAHPLLNPRQVANHLKANAKARPYDRHPQDSPGAANSTWGHGVAHLQALDYRGNVESEATTGFLLSRLFTTVAAHTTVTAVSSNPRLVAVAIRGGVLAITTSADEGVAIVTVTAGTRTVRIAFTVELPPRRFLRGWRLWLVESLR